MKCDGPLGQSPIDRRAETIIYGGRYAATRHETSELSLMIHGDRVEREVNPSLRPGRFNSHRVEIDLHGFLLMLGILNAHDHLECAPQTPHPMPGGD